MSAEMHRTTKGDFPAVPRNEIMDDVSPELEAMIDAALASPQPKPKRTQLPPRRRTRAGRLAWRIWKNRWRFSRRDSPYMNWWASLTPQQQEATTQTAEQYVSLAEMIEESLRTYREIGRYNDEEYWWRELCRMNQISLAQFRELCEAPVKVRSEFAREFGRAATRRLKDCLGVPAHRPKTRLSKADRQDDFWARKILAFLQSTS